MRSWAGFLTVAAVAFMLAGCGSTPGGNDLLHSDTLAKVGLQYYWGPLKVDLQECECIERMWLLDDQLFVMTDQNRLLCIDAAAGRWLWTYQVAAPGQKVYPPCVSKQVQLTRQMSITDLTDPDEAKFHTIRPVIINTYNSILLLDRDRGIAWREAQFDFPASTAGATEGIYFYVGGSDAKVHAVNLLSCTEDWSINCGGALVAPVACFDGQMYAASTANMVISAKTGIRNANLEWRQHLQGSINAAMAVSELGCFVPSQDGRLYAFDESSGLTRRGWDAPYDFASPLNAAPQLSALSVFQYASKDGLTALNAVNGSKRWNNPSALLVLACIDTDAYLLDRDNNLQVVDEIKGDAKTRLPMTGFDQYAANTDMPAVFAASRYGHIACIRPLSAGKRTVEMLTAPSGQATTRATTRPSN